MKRRILSILLTACMVVSAFVFPASASAAGLSNFSAGRAYTQGQYSDVSASNTFVDNVRTAYELGIMQGQSGSYFGVKSNLTRLAALIIACRIHSIYNTGTSVIESTYTGTTQEKYLQYAKANGLYTLFTDWSASVTRGEYALILGSALPDAALTAINTVADGSIPDVPATASYYNAVYRLYRAGILTGSDSLGTFYPSSYITRGAAAAIATRLASPALRRSVALSVSEKLTAEQVYARYSSAVAYIEVKNSSGTSFASGSGFFISADGYFVTCYHVIDGAYSAAVETTDGKTYQVSGVSAYSKTNDWAVLKVNGSGFNYLTVASASENVGGATVYAIGSPLGLENTISQGIVSNTSRTEDGTNYIQTTAAISSGSSGGALIATSGRVLGITSGSYVEGQNLNLAVPMTYVTGYGTGSLTSLSALAQTALTASAAGWDTLAGYLKKSGTYDETYGTYYVETLETTSDGGYNYGYMEYDPAEKNILFGYSYTDSTKSTVAAFIYLPAVAAQYQADLQSTDFGFKASGTITASSFTQNSTYTISSFSGSGSSVTRAQVQELAPPMLAADLAYAEVLLDKSGTGLTIASFGFTSMYQYLQG